MPADAARLCLPIALLLLPILAPGAAATAHAPAAPEEALRVYGCMDLLAGSGTTRHVAVPAPGQPGRGATDGTVDCAGDRVHLEPVWLDSDASPFLRRTLSPRDASIHPSFRYLPAAWFPAPGYGPGALADPRDGAQALFDVGTTRGVPEYSVLASPEARRLVPGDGAPDLRPRNGAEDPAADQYFPALELELRYHFHRGEDRPVALPPGEDFVFPFAGRATTTPGIDGWSVHGTPRATTWMPLPFGLGAPDDGAGALALRSVPIAQGDVIRFLDHSVRVVTITTGASPQVSLEVRYEGTRSVALIETHVVLSMLSAEELEAGARDASLTDGGMDARNLVFAGRTGSTRVVPSVPPETGAALGPVRPWFALLEPGDAPGEPTRLTLGRLVSERAPWNQFFVDGALYRVAALEAGADGGLRALSIAQIVPLGEDHTFAGPGITVAGLAPRTRLPLPAFLTDPHVRLRTLAIPLHTDPQGFLSDKDGATRSALGNRHLAPTPPQDAPRERTERASAFHLEWRALGVEERLAVTGVPARGEGQVAVAVVQPTRHVEVLLSPGRYRVDSALLADPGRPGMPVAFLYEPGRGPTLFADRAGNVRLAGAPAARAEDGDWLLFEPALVPFWEYPGLVRTASDIANERVTLALSYRPYQVWGDFGYGLVPVWDEASGKPVVDRAAGRGNNLHAVAERNDDATRGDLYGPALVLRYRFELLARGTYESIQPAPASGTQLLLPVASRTPGVPGLHSFDMNGDGAANEVRLAGWWAPDETGTWVAAATGVSVGTGLTPRGYLWLQSRPIHLPAEGSVQFFDHGAAFRFDASGARVELRAHAELDAPSLLQAFDADNLLPGQCIAARFDGRPVGPFPCTDASPVAPGGGHLWWAEVMAASPAGISLRMNRLAAPSSWANPGDAGAFFVGGAVYRWQSLETSAAPTQQAHDRFAALTLEQLVPLAGDAYVPWRGGELRVVGTATGALVPIAPPYSLPYERLMSFGLPLQRDAQGFTYLPDAGTPVAVPPAERLEPRPPLEVRVVGRDVEAAHRFPFIDATRLWEPQREGVVFLPGHFAGPPSFVMGPGYTRLDPAPRTGFSEVRLDVDERGWDHRLTLGVPFEERLIVDSARLGQAGLVATWIDRTSMGPLPAHPLRGDTNPLVARASAWWLVPPGGATDPYVITPIVREPPALPPGESPPPAGPQTEEPGPGSVARGVPFLAFLPWLGVVVFMAAWGRRRRAGPRCRLSRR